jgi:hypothetical protein
MFSVLSICEILSEVSIYSRLYVLFVFERNNLLLVGLFICEIFVFILFYKVVIFPYKFVILLYVNYGSKSSSVYVLFVFKRTFFMFYVLFIFDIF